MMNVPRFARILDNSESRQTEQPQQSLVDFREIPAWVLLAEPGAGKSTTLESEADECGGEYISIADFLHGYEEHELVGKTLFLDGLDEIRASSNDKNILLQVKGKLRRLDNPKFRLACRAADWLGSTDLGDIQAASPSGKITILLLLPLSQEDILNVLRENHQVSDPNSFVEKAQELGVDHLLENPQTLEMLAKAVRGECWPDTRQKTFQLACETLADEPSKRHRGYQGNSAISSDQLLDAAGQLCAAMLLSDKEGVALDQEQFSERYPVLDDYSPHARDSAFEVLHRNLFRLESQERVKPSHRSIAEYLAARWLAQEIDQRGLPLARTLNLLLGNDKRTVAGLRGLYGWLALHCRTARSRLIEADALTIVIYGDTKPLPISDKRAILEGLKKEASRLSMFHREARTDISFGALADPALVNDFLSAFTSTVRDNATQSYVDCLLIILREGERLTNLSEPILKIVKDDSWSGLVRRDALSVWLYINGSAKQACELLDEINQGRVRDSDDELMGMLLRHLYPGHLAAEGLLSYLHRPKRDRVSGVYIGFWLHDFAENGPDTHLPAILDRLVELPDLVKTASQNFYFKRMVGGLVTRGVVAYGEAVPDSKLFLWLTLASNEYGETHIENKDRDVISSWLQKNPLRYKRLFHYFLHHFLGEKSVHMRVYRFERILQAIAAPDDFGIWCLDQASLEQDDEITRVYLSEVMGSLIYQQNNSGLNMEKVELWAQGNEKRSALLKPELMCDISKWRIASHERRQKNKEINAKRRRERTKWVTKHLAEIKAGSANAYLMHQLAGVWRGPFGDVNGESIHERFESYSENGEELLAVATSGFHLTPKRQDLPSVKEIIDFSIDNREHYIRSSALIGMELQWEDGAATIDDLSDGALKRMVAFRLTYGCGNAPEWFNYVVETRASLVAEVYIPYVVTLLKAKKSYIDSLYALQDDQRYRALACLVVPEILKKFPLRAKFEQLVCLERLLKSALYYQLEPLLPLITSKLSRKSLDEPQRVYWLTVAMLLDADRYEVPLWNYIGTSQSRINYLSTFLNSRFSSSAQDYGLSVHTIGQLVEQLMSHAELQWSGSGGRVTSAMNRGDHVRGLINQLANLANEQASKEVERLLSLSNMKKVIFSLEAARNQIRLKMREDAFQFRSLNDVVKVLANKEPANVADLAALTLFHLDDIEKEIRHENDDGFRLYWRDKDTRQLENLCRDDLLRRFREKLKPFGIDCQLEVDHSNDKRADIKITYLNKIELPIEIKPDDNPELSTAANSQLIKKYSISPKAQGYGIYLVLWFGWKKVTTPKDGDKKPKSPKELQQRLEAMLPAEEKNRIFVRVIDVSWPK